MTAGSAPSLAQSVAPVDAGGHVTALGWLKGTATFGLADDGVALVKDDEIHRVDAHPDAGILVGSATANGSSPAATMDGWPRPGPTVTRRPWPKPRALGSIRCRQHGRSLCYGAGKRVFVRDDRGNEKFLDVPSAARGIAFAPKGYRLAISHYNGATLWFPNTEANQNRSNGGLASRYYLVARCALPRHLHAGELLHGWRLIPDKGHMRMSGYPSKTRSLSWSQTASGSPPPARKPRSSGPSNRRKARWASRRANAACVRPRSAASPSIPTPWCLRRYEDGCILLIRLNDAAELLVRPAVKDSGVTASPGTRAGSASPSAAKMDRPAS